MARKLRLSQTRNGMIRIFIEEGGKGSDIYLSADDALRAAHRLMAFASGQSDPETVATEETD